MSLDRYKKKRNFKKTKEPKPLMGHHNGKLHFVIQKHDASHLHYDFRLENHGVLKSWAVPKGVPEDSHTKRLAIEVEDHPLAYQFFEGVIPKGNYGAGTVVIWDKGEYYVDKNLSREENEKLIDQALKKGRLDFYLDGKKLKGHFMLIKIRGKKDNQWLLFKKDDRTPVATITLGAKKGQKTDNSDGVKTPMPSKISPMLATLVEEPFDREGWIFEVKWDGYRILSEIKNKQVTLYSRNNIDYTKHFPNIAAELKKLPGSILLDGEVVAVDEEGVSRFQLLQNFMKQPQGNLLYYVFDVLYLNGRDLRKVPLKRRKELLYHLINGLDNVRFSQYVQKEGREFFTAAKKHGLEGMIAKNLESTYATGRRSRDWLKVKAIAEQEAIICGFTEPRGSRRHLGALILGIYKDKELTYAGHTGGGFDTQGLKKMYDILKPLVVKECPFKVRPKTNAPVTWVKPQLICQVKFQEWTDDGHMRQPIFLGLREDKKPKEVLREKGDLSEHGTADVAVTNPDKIYWPKDGYTKGDMIEYYKKVAPYMMPYLKGRPQSLHRHPNGIIDKGFFQKDINYAPPDYIKLIDVTSENRGVVTHYLVCEDERSLTYMNNLGCIEINSWPSRADDLLHPDYMVLDFDPVDISFDQVIEVARTAQGLLKKIKAEGFIKTSGSRGLHIYIPLKKGKYTYDQVTDFAQIFCQSIHNRLPEITSLERSPSKRRGKVYLDYLQNHFTATMASPYSIRPLPGAPVSAPLAWAEVKKGLKPDMFNIKNILSRLNKKGDVWKGFFTKGLDMKAALDLLEPLR